LGVVRKKEVRRDLLHLPNVILKLFSTGEDRERHGRCSEPSLMRISLIVENHIAVDLIPPERRPF
jgi:hypothetical protein